MTPDELAAQLAPVRVPVEFASFGIGDALAMAALGLGVGLAVSWLLGVISSATPGPEDDLVARVDALGGKSREQRLAGLAALLHQLGVPLPDGLAEALYDPAAPFDPAIAERAVRDAVREGHAR